MWDKNSEESAYRHEALHAPLMAVGISLPQPETVTFDEPHMTTPADATSPYEGYVTPSLDTNGSAAFSPYYGDIAVNNEATPLMTTSMDESSALLGPQFRDVPFAILFLLQMGFMLYGGIFVAPKGFDLSCFNITEIEEEISKDEDVTADDMEQIKMFIATVTQYVLVYPERIFSYLILPSCIVAFLYAYIVTAAIVKPFSKPIVYLCLLGTVGWTLFLTLSAAAAIGHIAAYVAAAGVTGVVLYYVAITLRMVPFTAINLKVALEGISRNCGMYVVACLFAELGFAWVIYWLYTVVGVSLYENDKCQAAHPGKNFDNSSDQYDDSCDPPLIAYLSFLISLYWTNTVIMNTLQVTVAGVMATWCFDKEEANQCCSSAVSSSLYRSVTYSFGSICFGSLLHALICVFRYIVHKARRERERDRERGGCGSLWLCLLECMASFLEDIIEYFNQWAYVFVGIYGFSYLDSGKRALILFKERGWSSIITDNLVGYVLGFISFTVGVLTGATAIAIDSLVSRYLHDPEYDSYIFGPIPSWRIWAFATGFVIGIWVCSVMMNVVRGAVNTMIVCWADSPGVFELNHPALSAEIAEAWSQVFPHVEVRPQPASDQYGVL